MPLFHPRSLEKHARGIPVDAGHIDTLKRWADNLASGVFDVETQGDGRFIQRILGDVLGYVARGDAPKWTASKNQPLGGGNVDVALGNFCAESVQIIAPLELKGAKTNLDIIAGRNETPVQQAWRYANAIENAKWVLVSNYRTIRLYAYGKGNKNYESFDLATLHSDVEQYQRFILLLSAENLLGGKTLSLLEESERVEKDITNKFYKEYKEFRIRLIENIGKDNPKTDKLEIIRHTQKILDRVLFVAFAESRGLLPKKTLEDVFTSRSKFRPRPIWENFVGLFQAINEGNTQLRIPEYNGGLFADAPELDSLTVSDELCEGFRKIGDYDFNTDISVEILGHIFEQSISDLEELRAAAGETAGERKSKRKTDGVFYTPPYIARYIVEQTVGRWLADRRKEIGFDSLPELSDEELKSAANNTKSRKCSGTPRNLRVNAAKRAGSTENIAKHVAAWEAYEEALSRIKVLDPACGSGAFLIEVFDYLCREGKRINDELTRLRGYQDLFRWDAHILTNNLYGVDLNRESVEITKLSLWVKTAHHKEKLTYLDNNIKVGNSLIDDKAVAGDLAFDWNEEFHDIMANGGFDVIVGNPPYVRLEHIKPVSEMLAKMSYQTYDKRGDLYAVFVEKGFQLLKPSGVISYIMSNKWLQAGYGKSLRQFFLSKRLLKLIDFGDRRVFENATTYPCIFVAENKEPNGKFAASVLKSGNIGDFASHALEIEETLTTDLLDCGTWVISSPKDNDLLERLKNECVTLEDFVQGNANYGIKTGLTKAFQIDSETKKRLITEDANAAKIIKPMLRGKDIKPWIAEYRDYHLIATFPGLCANIDDYPSVKRYFLSFGQKRLEQSGKPGSRKKTPNKWFETQDTIAYWRDFAKPKIMYQTFQVKPCFIYDEQELYCNNSMWIIPTGNRALLAVLNSKMGWWLVTRYCTQIQNGYQLIWQYFGKIPIPKELPQSLETLADRMLSLHSDLQQLRQRFLKRLSDNFDGVKITGTLKQFDDLDFKQFLAELEKQKITLKLAEQDDWDEYFTGNKTKCQALTAQITASDGEIDRIVYNLYGLSEAEIALVENRV